MSVGRATLLVAGLAQATAFPCFAFAQEAADSTPRPVLLRMAADSAVVGHYRFALSESQRLSFDIATDDPRLPLLESATVPKERTIALAATIVSTPVEPDAERRYLAYWLGYQVKGEEVQALSSIQWDSIFRNVGRRAVLRFTPRGQPRGVEVTSDVVRPVGQALARVLSGMAMTLPSDPVTAGASWQDDVAITITAPSGSRWGMVVRVTYRLRELSPGPSGLVARIEYDGEPVLTEGSAEGVYGRYFGENLFSVDKGSYERGMAIANLEIEWKDTSGLPPSRSIVEWQAQFIRR